MWTQFALENFHFAVYVLTAVSFFGIGWLYFDAWQAKPTLKEGLKIVGFFLLGLSFLIAVLKIESSIFQVGDTQGNDLLLSFAFIVRLLGYFCVLVSLIIDPVPQSKMKTVLVGVSPVVWVLSSLFPLLATAVALLYLYRATAGKEDHLKPVAYGFMFMAIFELVSFRFLFSQTINIGLFELLKPYGSVWIVQNVCLFIATIFLGRWVWYYLLKRFQTQLFAIYTISVMVIFIVTTASFTGLLLSNVQQETITALHNNVSLLGHVIESKKSESLSMAQFIAQNQEVKEAIRVGSKTKIIESVQAITSAQVPQMLLITNEKGQAIVKDQDREGSQDFFSDDPLVKRALAGKSSTSLSSKEGAISPQVLAQGAVPVFDGGKLIGVVIVGHQLDEYFVDGVKKTTEYELSVYGNRAIAATSLMSESGRSRPLGLQITNEEVMHHVLEQHQVYTDGVAVLNVPYFASFAPLIDIDGRPIGMLSLMQPQLSVLQTAGKSIELTFLMSISLLLLSMIPAYVISKYLANQLE